MSHQTYFFYQKHGSSLNWTEIFSDNNIKYCKSGFNYKLIPLNVIWLIYNRFWKTTLVYTLILIFYILLLQYLKITNYSSITNIITVIGIFMSISTTEIFHFELKQNYEIIDIIEAKNENEAKSKFLNNLLEEEKLSIPQN